MEEVKKITDEELFSFVEFDSSESEKTGYSNYSYWGSVAKTFFKNKTAVILLIIMIALIVFAFFAVGTSKFEYSQIFRDHKLETPNSTYWFGTDLNGRDMWSRTWYGTTISLKLAAVVTLVNVVVGVTIGCLWGYVRQLDRFFTELYNIVYNIPSTVYLMLLTYILTQGFWTLVIALCSTGWLGMSRNVRNLVFMIRDREYNLASRCLGTPTHRMIIRNLIPYLVSVVILRLALLIPQTIASEVTLSFLGLGLPGTVPSLGQLLSQGKSKFEDFPHLLIFPTLIVSVITISFYLVGNAFSDASDPRNHV